MALLISFGSLWVTKASPTSYFTSRAPVVSPSYQGGVIILFGIFSSSTDRRCYLAFNTQFRWSKLSHRGAVVMRAVPSNMGTVFPEGTQGTCFHMDLWPVFVKIKYTCPGTWKQAWKTFALNILLFHNILIILLKSSLRNLQRMKKSKRWKRQTWRVNKREELSL